ncbi:CHRD domain-containing protein [Micromonospora sp. NPDC049679]|uniref:CHRD domain-containing protein n=1 Tax=Micromonospora sp. NPDC049679 TaxID=3155920 RepID=UPI0033F6E333
MSGALAGVVLGAPSVAMADEAPVDRGMVNDQTDEKGEHRIQKAKAALSGSQEDPLVIATPGEGKFWAKINEEKEEIEYKLSYEDLPTDVAAAHIHFGGKAQSGGIIAFLCSNGGNANSASADVPECPPGDGEVNGVLTPERVIGPEAQGINPGEFEKLVEAIKDGVAYVNVHTEQYPNGEIRGQVKLKERR